MQQCFPACLLTHTWHTDELNDMFVVVGRQQKQGL